MLPLGCCVLPAFVLLGVACLAAPAVIAPLWWLWIGLVDGPHLVATFTRTYLDAVWSNVWQYSKDTAISGSDVSCQL